MDRWFPEDFQRVVHRRGEFVFKETKESDDYNMLSASKDFISKTKALVGTWDMEPFDHEMDALKLIAYYLMDTRQWLPSNDMVVTTVAAVVFEDRLRAHTDSVVRYQQGAFQRIEELSCGGMIRIERALQLAAILFRELMNDNIPRSLGSVFDHLKEYSNTMLSLSQITSLDFRKGKDAVYAVWALDASKNALSLVPRFTGKAASASIVDLAGTWLRHPKPESSRAFVAFEDAMVEVKEVDGKNVLANIDKSPAHNCYFYIPCSIAASCPDWAIQELDLFVSTRMARTAHVLPMHSALDALVFMNQIIPPVQLLEYADGGNSKSAATMLRDNVWQGHHSIISPKCFQENDEFRKQGGQFAWARSMTVQECSPGSPLIEATWKQWVSGERLMCRPLFGETTEYFRWNRCAKYWETNWGFPSILGDPFNMSSLRHFTRRLRTARLHAVFTSDPAKVDVENAVFPENSELAHFLESPFARQGYIETYIVPWVLEHTVADTKAMLMNPPPEVVEDTRRVIATMANGGLELPEDFKTASELAECLAKAEQCVRRAHKETRTWPMPVKTYQVKSIKSIEGSYRETNKQARTRLNVLTDAVATWPHLMSFTDGRGGGFHRLEIDMDKFDKLVLECGGFSAFGGGWGSWETVWTCKSSLEGHPDTDLSEVDDFLGARTDAGSLVEVFNYVMLTESIANGSIQDARMVQVMLDQCARIENTDMAVRTVHYCRKHGIPGRRYAAPNSLQWLNKPDRRKACSAPPGNSFEGGKIFVDIDIDCCFPTLAVNTLSIHYDVEHELPVLYSYQQNYKAWRQFMQEYLGISKKAAKTMLTAIFHLGKPSNDIPFLWNLSLEMHRATGWLLQLDNCSHLQSKFQHRRNPQASRLHYALAEIEDQILADVESNLSEIVSLSVNTYMFDGCIVRLNGADCEELMRRLAHLGSHWKVSFTTERLE